jgi:hypothetical protein
MYLKNKKLTPSFLIVLSTFDTTAGPAGADVEG